MKFSGPNSEKSRRSIRPNWRSRPKDYALGFAQLSQEPDEEDVAKWDLVPDLDDDDLSTLASYLTDASEGAIVFTDAALSSWANNQYPYVQKMQASLVALARAACTYREVEGRIGSRLAEWVHAEFGVRCSAQDEPLQKLNKATFVYEGIEYSREPHLKLDDSTTPDRVGRVYFGIDQTDLRFIVDHVGLKLYGL